MDDLVPDGCRGEMRIPLDSAHITEYENSRCYNLQCPDYVALQAYCREDKKTGKIACAIRESDGAYSCPGKIEGGYIVNDYDPDSNVSPVLTNSEANGPMEESCRYAPLGPPSPRPDPKPHPRPHPDPKPSPHHPRHPHHPSPVAPPAPTLSCIDCRPANSGWQCGSCK